MRGVQFWRNNYKLACDGKPNSGFQNEVITLWIQREREFRHSRTVISSPSHYFLWLLVGKIKSKLGRESWTA